MTRPRITVGIPFFDEEPYLEAAIRSILAQSEGDLELLLVDDGSTDRSLEIARSFRDPRVVVHGDGSRRRLPWRLNQITALARGELVARMDGDDVAHPRRLEAELTVLADGACDAVGTWAALIDAEASPFAIVESHPELATQKTALARGLLVHASMLAKRSWLEAHPYDQSVPRAEDRDLWVRSLSRSRFGVVPEPLYVARAFARRVGFFADYAAAQRDNRMLLRRHGPAVLGRCGTTRRILESHGKVAITGAALALGMGDALLSRRGRGPTERERALVAEALAASRPTT